MGKRVERAPALPRRWGPRLWWVGLLVGVVASYFVLRNFEMSFWVFLGAFLAFAAGGSLGGRALGELLDRRLRNDSWMLAEELRHVKALRAWLERVLEKRGARLSEDAKRRLGDGLHRLKDVQSREGATWEVLRDARLALEQLGDEHLARYKKGVVREYVESIGVAVLIALLLRAFVLEAFQIPSGSMIPSLRVGDHIFVNKLSYGVRIPLLPLKIFGLRIPAVSWNWSSPARGEVIVFITPENEEEDYIKRVVAVGGDTIEVRGGVVYLNQEPYPLSEDGDFEYVDLDEDGAFRGNVATRRYRERIGELEHPILRKSCATDRDCLRIGQLCDLTQGLCVQTDFGPYTVPEGHVFCMGDNRDNSRDSRVWKSVPLEFVKGRAKFIWWSYREDKVQWERMFTGIH
ncbi:MAG TPA: signal peptidase I [Myxococcota bacterium]|nr:signal peptidase I [Myxococcota bacterium]HRY94155.1 signal peptidase I [Myxococcota bacterium]